MWTKLLDVGSGKVPGVRAPIFNSEQNNRSKQTEFAGSFITDLSQKENGFFTNAITEDALIRNTFFLELKKIMLTTCLKKREEITLEFRKN